MARSYKVGQKLKYKTGTVTIKGKRKLAGRVAYLVDFGKAQHLMYPEDIANYVK